LDNFPGTILLVTHDRYLVDRLATQLWIIDPKGRELEVFHGTWAEYVEARNQDAQTPQARQARDKWSEDERQARREEQRARREQEARQQRASELEMEIHDLEAQLRSLQSEIAIASETQQAMRLHELGMLYAELEGQLQRQIERWAELAG
jgi:ATP-binding cassette subfamily F protein 3